jgi:DNA-binding winged helix-turn-helix (wHTH) protein/TolB-like protein/tetratricopeptide (TPR) repeat protein
MEQRTSLFYEFGPFRLDAGERLLLRDGHVVPLTPKLFDILLVLVQNRGHILEKEEVLKAVWQDTIVEEGNLTRNVSTLRKALGENPNDPHYIETIPWRGYRFIADVHERSGGDDLVIEEHSRSRIIIETDDATNSVVEPIRPGRALQSEAVTSTLATRQKNKSRTITISAGAVLLIVFAGAAVTALLSGKPNASERTTAIKSIAVLPFKPISQEGRDEYLELGMADTLITRLSSLKQLAVRPTSAVRKYAGLEQDPVAAGQELRVETVLDGSIQKLGDRIRVTVRLLSTKDGLALWTYKCDDYCTDIFGTQDSITERVAKALMVKLSGDQQKLLAKHYTENTRAYQLYLTGRYFWNKRTAEGLNKGIQYFQQAIDQDPNYALAYAGIAQSYIPLGFYGYMSPAEARDKASAAAKKALDMDDTLAEAHSAMAVVKAWSWLWADAEEEYQRAIELNPNYAPVRQWYSEYPLEIGRREESFEQIRLARELDPTSLVLNAWIGFSYYYDRQYDRAVEHFQRVSELDPNFVTSHWFVGLSYAEKGRFDEAIAELQRAVELSNGASRIRADLAYAYALSGRKREALARLKEITDLSKAERGFAYDVAVIYAGLGEKELVLSWLERAYDERSVLFQKLKADPKLDLVRPDPRFTDLLRRVGLAQ